MKRTLWIIPLLALTAFAGYHRHWSAANAPSRPTRCSDPYENRDGRREAELALRAGKLVVLTYGLPAAWSAEYRKILQADYGIEERAIAGCVVTTPLLKFARDYNECMNRHITAIHGPDVFERAAAKAQALPAERGGRDAQAAGLD